MIYYDKSKGANAITLTESESALVLWTSPLNQFLTTVYFHLDKTSTCIQFHTGDTDDISGSRRHQS